MKKLTTFDYTVLVSAIVVAGFVFVVTLLTYTPEPQSPVSPERIHEIILRAAGGFAVLGAFAVFVLLIVWREILSDRHQEK